MNSRWAWALFLHGHMWRGIGEHWVGVGLANLERLEKILLVLRGIGIGICVGGCMAWRAALICRRTTRTGQVGSWAEVAKIYGCWYWLGGAARIHWMGLALVCVLRRGLRSEKNGLPWVSWVVGLVPIGCVG